MKFEPPVLAVIVLYKIKLEESPTFNTLTESLIKNGVYLDLLVYDNSPVNGYNVNEIQYHNWNLIYYGDTENSGVSKAYNAAAKQALKTNKKWLLLLDQDTIFPIQTISQYLLALSNYPNQKLFAPIMKVNDNNIISPCKFKYMRGFYIRNIKNGINSLRQYSIINSGLFISVDLFMANNGYNENIKLDFSDHDFMHRLKKNGVDDFVVIDLVVTHELSSAIKNSLLSDQKRFDYYLIGGSMMASGLREIFFLTLNSFLRASKLSVQHKNASFVKKVIKHHLKVK
jgi:rhamnosyltransferase